MWTVIADEDVAGQMRRSSSIGSTESNNPGAAATPSAPPDPGRSPNRSDADVTAYAELAAYTLTRGDAAFLHQHVVDAYAVQTASPADDAIRTVQALVGLYLHVDHGLTGRQIQRVHQLVANRRPTWPALELPADRGPMSVRDVVAEPPGEGRDRAIEAWAASVWRSCSDLRDALAAFLAANDITPPARSDDAHREGCVGWRGALGARRMGR